MNYCPEIEISLWNSYSNVKLSIFCEIRNSKSVAALKPDPSALFIDNQYTVRHDNLVVSIVFQFN